MSSSGPESCESQEKRNASPSRKSPGRPPRSTAPCSRQSWPASRLASELPRGSFLLTPGTPAPHPLSNEYASCSQSQPRQRRVPERGAPASSRSALLCVLSGRKGGSLGHWAGPPRATSYALPARALAHGPPPASAPTLPPDAAETASTMAATKRISAIATVLHQCYSLRPSIYRSRACLALALID